MDAVQHPLLDECSQALLGAAASLHQPDMSKVMTAWEVYHTAETVAVL